MKGRNTNLEDKERETAIQDGQQLCEKSLLQLENRMVNIENILKNIVLYQKEVLRYFEVMFSSNYCAKKEEKQINLFLSQPHIQTHYPY